MLKKVSVIMPMYNAEKYLNRSLGSIINQTYTNLEIIVVNDGSDDKSREIVESFKEKDKRIKLINMENHGVSHARNVGLSNVTGDYVQFVDADDDLDLNYFDKMVSLIEKNDADVAICNNIHPVFFTHLDDYVYDMKDHDEFLKFYQHTFASTFPWNKLFKREIVDGIYFEEDISFAEDEAFFCSVVGKINKIVSTKEVLYHYYLAPSSDDKSSAIVSILTASKFWVNHTSFYYKEVECLPIKIEYLSKYVMEKRIPLDSIEDVLYQRLFDYTFYQYAVYVLFGLAKENLFLELMNIFRNTFFHKAVKVQEKYGLKFKSFKDKDLEHIVYELNESLYKMYQEVNATQPKGILPIYCAFMLFNHYFLIEDNDIDNVNNLNMVDKLSKDSKNPNTIFVKHILNID